MICTGDNTINRIIKMLQFDQYLQFHLSNTCPEQQLREWSYKGLTEESLLSGCVWKLNPEKGPLTLYPSALNQP